MLPSSSVSAKWTELTYVLVKNILFWKLVLKPYRMPLYQI